MQGNSNRSTNSFGPVHDHKETDMQIFHNEQSVPVTAQPQQFNRTFNQVININSAAQVSPRGNGNSGKPETHYVEPYAQNKRPWFIRSHHLDPNTRLSSSDSVVINFDSISEPSTSNSGNLYELYTNRASLEQLQENVSSLESGRESDNQNFSNQIRECNIDLALHNNNNNNNNNFNNQNSHQNNNNHSNASVSQNSEGPPGETPNIGTSGSQSLEKIFNKYIPFVTFLSLKAIYDHREGILIFLGLLITFIHANSVVKREIAKQGRRSLISLGIIFINLFVSICFIYFVFQEQQLYKILVFIPPYSQPLSIWDVLWIVGITDFVLKFLTIQLKVGMACFPAKFLPYSARGKWYLLLERASQLYRGLTPIQPWLYYLMEVYQGSENMVGMFFSVAYIVSKGSDIMSKVKLFSKALSKLIQNASLGVRPSNEELISAGSQCPICHDEFSSPIILQCKHVFCESCVSTWFDREQTCPLCRAKIADDPSWRDGATSLFTQLF